MIQLNLLLCVCMFGLALALPRPVPTEIKDVQLSGKNISDTVDEFQMKLQDASQGSDVPVLIKTKKSVPHRVDYTTNENNRLQDEPHHFNGVRYTPLDLAQYILRTRDEESVALAIEELLKQDLIDREEAILYLENVKKELGTLKQRNDGAFPEIKMREPTIHIANTHDSHHNSHNEVRHHVGVKRFPTIGRQISQQEQAAGEAPPRPETSTTELKASKFDQQIIPEAENVVERRSSSIPEVESVVESRAKSKTVQRRGQSIPEVEAVVESRARAEVEKAEEEFAAETEERNHEAEMERKAEAELERRMEEEVQRRVQAEVSRRESEVKPVGVQIEMNKPIVEVATNQTAGNEADDETKQLEDLIHEEPMVEGHVQEKKSPTSQPSSTTPAPVTSKIPQVGSKEVVPSGMEISDPESERAIKGSTTSDSIYEEYLLEKVIYQLAKDIVNKTPKDHEVTAEELLSKFASFLEHELGTKRFSKEFQQKILDMVSNIMVENLRERL